MDLFLRDCLLLQHPVQERIAECNGTQCGFCTPGHVMAMYSLLREQPGKALSPGEIEERFDGTICRCTGYRPIMTACHSFASEGVPGEEEKVGFSSPFSSLSLSVFSLLTHFSIFGGIRLRVSRPRTGRSTTRRPSRPFRRPSPPRRT